MKKLIQAVKDKTKDTPLTNIQKASVGGLFILLGITFVQSQLSQLLNDYADLMLSAVLPSVIVELTNEEREDRDVDMLVHNNLLDETARRKAEHMRDNQYFAHDSPEGIEPWYWFDEVGYDYAHAGENLAIYFDESDEVVEAWMESPLHRDNVLKGEYTEIGVAAVEGEYKGFDTVFVVQHFGTPAVRISAEEVNVTPLPELETPQEVTTPEVAVEENETPNTPTILPAETQALEEPEIINELPISPPQIQVPDEQVTTAVTQGEMTVYVSDHDATSTNKEEELVITPAVTQGKSIPLSKTPDKNTLNIMNFMFLFLAIGITLALTVSTVHHHHHARPLHAAYGIALLLVTTLLMNFHMYVVEAFSVL